MKIRQGDNPEEMDEICKLRGCEEKFKKGENALPAKLFFTLFIIQISWLGSLTGVGLYLFRDSANSVQMLQNALQSEVTARVVQRLEVTNEVNEKFNQIIREIRQLEIKDAGKH